MNDFFLWIFIIHKKRLTLFKHFLNHSKSFWIILNPHTVNTLNANTFIAFCTLNTSNTSHTSTPPPPAPLLFYIPLSPQFPTPLSLAPYLLHGLQIPATLYSVPYSHFFSFLPPLSSASYSPIFSFLHPYLQFPAPLSSAPYSTIFSSLLPYPQLPTPQSSDPYSRIVSSLLPYL